MKITILEPSPEEEDEIIVKCRFLDNNITLLLNQLKNGNSKMNFIKDNKIVLVEKKEILFFESVDDKVFAYTLEDVFETKLKLYELEQILPAKNFFRANKAVIVNLNKIRSLSPAFSGRFEAILKNDYKVIISRNYVPALKERLGL
ncbi:LytTR family DNA-binding domain-containing protein [Treponema sp.]|uniref:LytTR family DNA-binding domain-containing protein n=1 Tax=Treponema sp. TaxID=166 RepID=UPI00298E2FBA|nr:LytTR family DNA-binding domain-containing protein [Treponema sp.]MCR5612301.1 LytTR family transcriptional regulator DNA-binding domain-containing protein [Treponema sp.]